MTIAPDLLKILCCPETHQALELADPALVQSLNTRIAAGEILNRAGQRVSAKVDAALIRLDRNFLYPIRGDIPVLLVDEAIPLTDGSHS